MGVPILYYKYTYSRLLKAIWIHGWHDEDVGVVDEPRHPRVLAVVVEQILGQEDHELASDGLVAVHVGHVLDHWLAELPLGHVLADLQDEELAALDGLADRVDARQAGKLLGQIVEELAQLIVVRVMRHDEILVDAAAPVAAARRAQ